MGRRKKSDALEDSGHGCAWAGCSAPGNYRAPRSRDTVRDYQWFCQDHITEFNKRWNYFEGMTQDEIYAYQRDATTGHRPTWRMDQMGKNLDTQMEEAFAKLFGDGSKTPYKASAPPVSAKSRDALAMLDLEHPAEAKAIKSQYRILVKKYHPDINHGNRAAEEQFKKITLAYQHLITNYVER